MQHVTRRALLLGGALALGAAGAGGPALADAAARGTDRDRTAERSAFVRLGDPAPFVDIGALAARTTMQDLVLVPENGWLFVSQAVAGSNDSSETTVINRVRVSDGVLLDSMQLVDGGHGLGFEVQLRSGQPWVWMTWHGSDDDVVRLRYVPGSYRYAEADDRLGLERIAFQHKEGRDREAVYHFDAAGQVAVERHFHFSAGAEATSETYYRRSVSALLTGSSTSRGSVTLPATPPTVQGFATVGDSLFRLVGATATNGVQDARDPMAIEQHSWTTGRLVAKRQYPDLARDGDARWKDGIIEPQGLGVRRTADGGISLLLGATTGGTGRREHQVLEIPTTGSA
ncbi:hypothetical protein [uncultured Amnibacterium sp.]|uniref:phage baseplate protein n=1 Tax=uncultured Amnibacterium sp. TaxID=1631851 RepID=UPI0035C9FAA8